MGCTNFSNYIVSLVYVGSAIVLWVVLAILIPLGIPIHFIVSVYKLIKHQIAKNKQLSIEGCEPFKYENIYFDNKPIECPICIQDFTDNCHIIQLECSQYHIFHHRSAHRRICHKYACLPPRWSGSFPGYSHIFHHSSAHRQI